MEVFSIMLRSRLSTSASTSPPGLGKSSVFIYLFVFGHHFFFFVTAITVGNDLKLRKSQGDDDFEIFINFYVLTVLKVNEDGR